MPNFPNSNNVLPGVVTDVATFSSSTNAPGGVRIAAIIGEGSIDEVIVSQANGNGKDGLNPTYSSFTGADGRHFRLKNVDVISKRTTLFKNGVPLVGREAPIDGSTFSNKFDYTIDIESGKIELQKAHLVDQGGTLYTPLASNVGDGYLSGLSLEDLNAPPESWTVRCVSVQRDSMNNPISGTAKFISIGTVSGAKLDRNGNPIIWTSNGTTTSNTVLKFAINADITAAFKEGDGFLIKVDSGVLVRGDSLTANYIAASNINDPLIVQGMTNVSNRHGYPSTTNTLSLGCQLAMSNAASVVLTVQAAPAIPRRVSYILSDSLDTTSTDDETFIFPLPLGVVPDFESMIHFFVTNNSTNVEKQILPNKIEFYSVADVDIHDFITSNVDVPGGTSYCYTVIERFGTTDSGFNGTLTADLASANKAVFNTAATYDSSYVNKAVRILDSVNTSNNGLFRVASVSNGKLNLEADGSVVSGSTSCNPSYLSDFVNENGVQFDVIDPVSGAIVSGGSGTDGDILISGSGIATFSSLTIDFSTITGVATYKLKISGSTSNDGLYSIDSLSVTDLVISKEFVDETGLRYEIIDPNENSSYVVVNKNVVPNSYRLRVTLVDTDEATFYDAGWINALQSLESQECDMVVALPKETKSVIFQNALAHCQSMSSMNNRKERVLLCGAIRGLEPNNVSGNPPIPVAVENIGVLEGIQGYTETDILEGNIEDLANYSVEDAFGSTYRCIYLYPDEIVVQAGTESVFLDGFYLAAAAAGWLSASVKIQEPLTNKVLSGFSILRNKTYSTFVLEQLAAAGITTLQPVSGGGRVIWGITTTQSGFPEEEEISIVFIRDRIAKMLRSGFEGYIGTSENPETLVELNSQAIKLMNAFVTQGLITQYRGINIEQDQLDPRQWNISVGVRPAYSINWIYIKVNVGQV